ncbi:hypothetical protein [Streptomyces sp. NPDC018947]|uniref:hypothetical protein n=1 Tax=Streptomyces sp. NPDC018947 TaxID=3365054 RepID=UPI0037AD1FAB
MRASELATAAVQVMTGGTPVAAEQKSAVQELVWGRLGRSTLGASALARLHEQPGEGSAGIVTSVLTDELRTDRKFAEQMARALHVPHSASPQTATRRRAASVAPPPLPTARPAAAPSQVPDAADVRRILLLGLPQAFLAYVLLTVASRNGAGTGVQVVILLAATSLAAYGVWLGISLLLRRIRSGALVAAILFDVLVLVRLILWLVGAVR